MAMARIEVVSDSKLQVFGDLGFDNAVLLRQQGERLLSACSGCCEIDLSNVEAAGSAALSLLLSWMRYAESLNMALEFSHVPESLLGVAQVSELDSLLPFKFRGISE